MLGIPMLELDADLGRNDANSKSIQMKTERVSIQRPIAEDLFNSEPDVEMLKSWIADAKNSMRSVED